MTLRVEQKFCIHSNKLQEFYIWLNSNQGKILYPKRKITSIYFDNLSFTSYTDAIEGTVPRKKIRLRFYNDNYKKTNLETKINSVEGRSKHSLKIKNHYKIIEHGYFDNNYGLCFPVVKISYLRQYFQVMGLRVTLDTNINYINFNEGNENKYDQRIILECKTQNLKNINYIDQSFEFEKIRFSKYCNSIENLNII